MASSSNQMLVLRLAFVICALICGMSCLYQDCLHDALKHEAVWVWVLVSASPSVLFWILVLSLDLCGVNCYYDGKVTVREMVSSQLCTDAIQITAVLFRVFVCNDKSYQLRLLFVALGLILVDVVEYVMHRLAHIVPWMHAWHKRHHRLVPLHTFGALFIDPRETLLFGAALGASALLCGLSVLETTCAAALAAIWVIRDHTPSRPGEKMTRHERHHAHALALDLATPFSGFWDWVCGTRFCDSVQDKPELYLTARQNHLQIYD